MTLLGGGDQKQYGIVVNRLIENTNIFKSVQTEANEHNKMIAETNS